MINSAHWTLTLVRKIFVELSGAVASSHRVSNQTGLSRRSVISCSGQPGGSSVTELQFDREKTPTQGGDLLDGCSSGYKHLTPVSFPRGLTLAPSAGLSIQGCLSCLGHVGCFGTRVWTAGGNQLLSILLKTHLNMDILPDITCMAGLAFSVLFFCAV